MIGTTLNGRFLLEKELGKGGMGAVYKATDQVLGRSVAIKILKDQTGDQVGKKLRLEAQILARLLHEHVVRLYDFGENDGLYYFVMEEVDGSSFQKRWRQVNLTARLQILIQVAEALDYAHRQGVIHRDVKPANVLMTSTDKAKLSDFGLSLLVEQAQDTGVIRGTPHYMSPEQAKGKRLDHRTDLYALGVMLYECTTGGTPFMGPTLAVIAHHATTVPESPRLRNPEIAQDLEILIMRLLAKEPVERPSTGLEVAQELKDFLGSNAAALNTVIIAVEPSIAAMAVGNEVLKSIESPAAVTGATLQVPKIESGSVLSSKTGVVIPTSGEVTRSLPRRLLEAVIADPVQLSADERYLSGHYLAYLLGGSRRRGILQRRPLDPLNADRARLLLAMTWLMASEGSPESMNAAVDLLELKPDVRPLLSPVVVLKYLTSRDTAPKRKRFRQLRKDLQGASSYAMTKMTDAKGVLNPGLMPQALGDLSQLAPVRTEIDDELVARWNRISEVWRARPDFRQAVLRYATTSAWQDPSSAELWPEVVYPLIERARWQRRRRTSAEAAWDNFCATLRLPDAGLRLDSAIRVSVPAPDIEHFDLSLSAFDVMPAEDVENTAAEMKKDRLVVADRADGGSFHDLEVGPSTGSDGVQLVRLVNPDATRITMGELRALWNEAMISLRQPGNLRPTHKPVPIGQYQLAVVPSIRGRSAGTVAIQGMRNKQIEMLTASIQVGSSSSKPIIAAWTYADQSLIVAYVSFQGDTLYIFWHAPTSHQNNYDDAGVLNHDLLARGMEAPDQLGVVLTKKYRPKHTG